MSSSQQDVVMPGKDQYFDEELPAQTHFII